MAEEKDLEEQMKEEQASAEAENAAEEAVKEQDPAPEAENAAEESKEPESRKDKKASKKAEKADKEKTALKEKVEELEDKVKRQLAEFENFRNRTEKEKTESFDLGARSVIEKLLPVVDNFERGLATVPEDKADDPYVDGMNRIYRQLMTELEKMGVEPIEAVGQPFDPNLHNAVMQAQSDELESGTVAQELQKGYKYHDKVVRHSMVSVVE
ncbi:MAG: nucleotide exchange factor GrpE [Lachnospiraceae bacterium]|nr:nucleotide exchange factor GrpE [Lachnospiraceae bacterium]